MVMESVPSAHCVGREFVKQYYMMLNQAPQFLHRFYSHNSSFVHARMDQQGDKPVEIIGQAEIYKKIASLNFRDCRAKIRQVDSQSTVSDSVLIQVIGELSNDGGSMRPFVQTFLLVAQSPKKYYVHNDIFRYLDEVLIDDIKAAINSAMDIASDVEGNGEVVGVPAGHVGTGGVDIDGLNMSPSAFYSQQEPAASNGNTDHSAGESGVYIGQNSVISSSTAVETGHDVAVATGEASETSAEQPMSDVDESPATEPHKASDHTNELARDSRKESSSRKVSECSTDNAEPPANNEPKVVKPMTWAAMAGKTLPSPTVASAVVQPRSAAGPTVRASAKPPAAQQTRVSAETRSESNQNTHNAVQPRQQRVSSRPQPDKMMASQESTEIDSSSHVSNDGDEQRRTAIPQQNYPDSQQIFVGNLPQFLSDKDIREFFSQFGEVIEMKINRKNGVMNNLPFFGFIVFDSAETTQKVLANTPLFMACGNGRHRINVEEKKPRAELVAARPRSAPRGGIRPSYGRGSDGYGRGRSSYGNSSSNPVNNSSAVETDNSQNSIAEDSQNSVGQ